MKKTPLRILMITQGVSRIVQPILSSQHKVVGILESAPRGFDKKINSFSLFSFLSFVYSKFSKKRQNLKNISGENNIPYRFMSASDDPDLGKWIKSLNPDVIVVFSMSRLLKENIFSIPRLGTINLHSSFLPEYRGPNPDFWHYYNMDLNPGVSVHFIDKGEDTGDIIAQRRISVPLGLKSPDRLDLLIGRVGVEMLVETLDNIASDESVSIIRQDRKSSTIRARNITPEEHKSIIQWDNWPIERIWNLLRGTELWLNALPQPKGIYYGQRWSVGEYKKFSGQTQPPGSIYKYKSCYCVATVDGSIYLSCSFKLKKLIIKLFRRR